MAIHAIRLDLDTDLTLLPGLWQEQLPGDGISIDERIETCRVGNIGRDADRRVVDRTNSTGEFGIVSRLIQRKQIVVVQVYPVVAAARDERQSADLDLVLAVNTCLLLCESAIGSKRRGRRRQGNAIDRIEQVESRSIAVKWERLQVGDLVV